VASSPRPEALLEKLRGGDRRSIGRVDEVAAEVLARPALFGTLVEGMLHEDPLVRMRAADAAEKVSARHPDWLEPHRRRLLGEAAAVEQQEVRWHVAQMIPRLPLRPSEEDEAVRILLGYLDDRSRIVKTSSMQALADLALRAPRLRPRVHPVLEELTRTGSAAMRSRGRKLLRRLGTDEAGANGKHHQARPGADR
jgi:HEAT repeat protein